MRGAFAVRAMVGVLTVWALITIVPDFTRIVRPLASLGVGLDFGGRVVEVTPHGPAAIAGVRASTPEAAGDRIDFERTSRETLFALYGGLGGRPFVLPGRRLELGLDDGSGTPRTVTIVALERDPPVLERLGLLLDEVFGVAFIALGALLAWNFPQRRDVFGFFLYAIFFNPGQDYVFYALLPPAMWVAQDLLSTLLQALGLAGFVVFALRFPTDRSEGWRASAERLLPVFVIALTVVTLVGSGAEFGRPNQPFWLAAFWLKLAVYPLVAFAFISKLQLLEPVEQQRLRLVIFGCIPGLLMYLLAESADATTLWQPVFDRLAWTPPEALLNCGYLANALVPVSIGYAVVRRHVLPIDFIINRGLTLGIVWVVVAMSVEATVLTTHALLAENHVVSTLVLAALLVTVAPLLERLKDAVNVGVDRVLFVRLHRARNALQAAAGELGSAGCAQIEAAIVNEPCAKLGLAAAALFALDEDGRYRLRAAHEWPATALDSIESGDPLLAPLAASGRRTNKRPERYARADLPAGAAHPQLVLTLAPEAVVEAVVIFSGHANGSTLSPDEVLVITRFVRDCDILRARAQAKEMRQEVVALRRALSAGGALTSPG